MYRSRLWAPMPSDGRILSSCEVNQRLGKSGKAQAKRREEKLVGLVNVPVKLFPTACLELRLSRFIALPFSNQLSYFLSQSSFPFPLSLALPIQLSSTFL